MYGPHHIAISVSDVTKSQAFYEQLDFKKVGEWAPDDGSYKIVNLRNGNLMLELFCYSNPKPLPAHNQDLWQDLSVLGVKHFGLAVDSIDETQTSLQTRGHDIMYRDVNKDRSGANFFFIKDPDGILIEIIEDNRGI